MFTGAEMWEYSPKTVKISNVGHNLPLRGHSFAQFFRKFSDFIRVHTKLLVFNLVTFGDKQPSYKHFSVLGAFFHKFSKAPSGEILIGSKKLGGAKNCTELLYITPSMLGIVGRAIDEKV